MAHYNVTLFSQTNVDGCHRSFLQAVDAAKWVSVKSDAQRIVCREPNVRGDWEEDLVTIEVDLELIPNGATRIVVNARSGRAGDPANAYARLQVSGLLRRVEPDLKPQKVFS